MIEMVYALSKDEFSKLTDSKHPKISILDPDASRLIEDSDFTLTQWFADWNPWSDICISNKGAMSSDQAKEIVRFISRLHTKSEKFTLLVHCSAGVCRSGAIAQFVQQVCDIDYNKFKSYNSHIQPNDWVLNQLASVYTKYAVVNST